MCECFDSHCVVAKLSLDPIGACLEPLCQLFYLKMVPD